MIFFYLGQYLWLHLLKVLTHFGVCLNLLGKFLQVLYPVQYYVWAESALYVYAM